MASLSRVPCVRTLRCFIMTQKTRKFIGQPLRIFRDRAAKDLLWKPIPGTTWPSLNSMDSLRNISKPRLKRPVIEGVSPKNSHPVLGWRGWKMLIAWWFLIVGQLPNAKEKPDHLANWGSPSAKDLALWCKKT